MIRFIASDIDGTLLQNGESTINARFFELAARLADKGVVICAASGRQYPSLRHLFAPMADRMYFVCENGAVVFGPGDKPELISRTEIDRETSLALCRDILDVPECELLISGTNCGYICPKTREYADHLLSYFGSRYTVIPSPEDMPEAFVKISCYRKEGSAEIAPHFLPRWKDRFNIAVAGQPWLDFTVADKGTGILALLRHLGIRPEEAMVFGDNFNDVPMFDVVGHPILMESACEELRTRYPVRCSRPEGMMETLLRSLQEEV